MRETLFQYLASMPPLLKILTAVCFIGGIGISLWALKKIKEDSKEVTP